MILVLQTTTFSAHGGIPAYNRMVCRALNELDDSAIGERRVLIAMDRKEDLDVTAKEFPNLTLESFGGSRPRFVQRVTATALREPIALALIGHVNHAPLGLLLKRLRPNLRYGVMVHGVEAWTRLPRLSRRALRNADFVLSVSDYTKRQLAEVNGVNPEQVYLLPNTLAWSGKGANCEESTSDLRPLTSGSRLLSVCRLDSRERYKGVDTVIKALPAVLARVPNLEYVVVGSGSDFKRHQELAAELGVADHVEFLGSVDEQTLRSLYESCDVFALPSAGEGFGIVFLEAMHYRKPIIAANAGATSEVVTDGETGMLIEYGNVEQLAAAIIALSRDPEERDRMGRAGGDRFQEKFAFNHFKRRLNEIVLGELSAKASRLKEPRVARRAGSFT